MDIQHGIHGGLTRADLPEGLSPSGAKTLLFKTPAMYQWERQHPKEPTRSMVLGTLVHGLVLEGRRLYIEVADRRTKAGKEAAAEAEAQSLVAVTPAEREQVEGMAQSVLEHPLAAGILSEGEPEQAVIWADQETGVTCRGFIDWLRTNAIVDLKSADTASPVGFAKQAANLHYDLQSAMYREGIRALTGCDLPFIHIAVETRPPHLVAVHQFPAEADERGLWHMRQAIDLYAKCIETGDWPGYSDEVIPTPWPRWAS